MRVCTNMKDSCKINPKMNVLGLASVLLFAFSIPVVMGYRILPIEGTPYWLFGLLFILLVVNILRPKLMSLILWPGLLIVIGGTTITAVIDRSKTAPVYGVHDIILQQEAAMRFLLQGKNPYKETYFGTPVAEFNYAEIGNPNAINPALYHFVMPPWYLLFPFSIYFLSIPVLGYFDGRIALLMAMGGLIIVIWKWFRHKPLAMLTIVITALSPATINYFVEGRSDIFALFWFVWSLYLLENKRFFWSALIFGLAVMSKQTIWLAIPFYLLIARKYSFVSVIVVGLLALPFLWKDASAFIGSTVFYLSGQSATSYPISGYGFGMFLREFGIISDTHAYYPFIIWQIILGLPVFLVFLRALVKKPMMSRLLLGYAVSLAVFWYLSRYFNNSHLSYLSSLFVLSTLKAQDEAGI